MKPRPPRLRRTSLPGLVPVAAASVIALALGACGSSARTVSAAELQSQCTNVADVLSDGPDPNADPVGYAEAQVLPLRQLRIADPDLRRIVTRLAGDYAAYANSNGLDAAQAVSKEEGILLALCPKGEGSQVLPGQVLP